MKKQPWHFYREIAARRRDLIDDLLVRLLIDTFDGRLIPLDLIRMAYSDPTVSPNMKVAAQEAVGLVMEIRMAGF